MPLYECCIYNIIYYAVALVSPPRLPFFSLTFGPEKKGLAKWSVWIGDSHAEKISACEPLAFNTSLCTAPRRAL